MQLKSVRIETMVLKKLKTTYIANHKIKKTFHWSQRSLKEEFYEYTFSG